MDIREQFKQEFTRLVYNLKAINDAEFESKVNRDEKGRFAKKNSKSIESKQISQQAINESRKQLNNLSKSEIDAIKIYTDDNAYTTINRYLRGEIDKSQISAENLNAINLIENGLKKTHIPENIVVYRGVNHEFAMNVFGNEISDIMMETHYNTKTISDNDLNKIQKEILNKEFIDKGFVSTSYTKDSAFDRMILFEINVPKGTNGVVVDKISKLRELEKEILLNKGYKFEITNIEYNEKWLLYANLII